MPAGLTVLYGPPAAGKTTYAAAQHDATHINLDQLAVDSAVLAGAAFHSSAGVWQHAQALAEQALRDGRHVIFDYFAVERVYRRQLLFLARRCRVPSHLIIIDAPLDLCLTRNQQRTGNKRLPDDMMHTLYDAYLADLERVQDEPWSTITTMPSVEHEAAR